MLYVLLPLIIGDRTLKTLADGVLGRERLRAEVEK